MEQQAKPREFLIKRYLFDSCELGEREGIRAHVCALTGVDGKGHEGVLYRFQCIGNWTMGRAQVLVSSIYDVIHGWMQFKVATDRKGPCCRFGDFIPSYSTSLHLSRLAESWQGSPTEAGRSFHAGFLRLWILSAGDEDGAPSLHHFFITIYNIPLTPFP